MRILSGPTIHAPERRRRSIHRRQIMAGRRLPLTDVTNIQIRSSDVTNVNDDSHARMLRKRREKYASMDEEEKEKNEQRRARVLPPKEINESSPRNP
ncbi:hypothetical protein C2845_PM15G21980 [Panicum miliaceum]|uniref:Uncharacterized protein n=1 Tax=Panicum miliaceum TaxID=4540 RepID=A0A3L6QC13_PANMI|nr:hypothetical protein C2845_PM15G21980 [Panicum miliaceum]